MWVWIATFRCHAGYELGRARDLVEGTHERLDPKGEVMTSFGMQAVRELSWSSTPKSDLSPFSLLAIMRDSRAARSGRDRSHPTFSRFNDFIVPSHIFKIQWLYGPTWPFQYSMALWSHLTLLRFNGFMVPPDIFNIQWLYGPTRPFQLRPTILHLVIKFLNFIISWPNLLVSMILDKISCVGTRSTLAKIE